MATSRVFRSRFGHRLSSAAALLWTLALPTACASQQLSLESANAAAELTPVLLTSRVEQAPSQRTEPSSSATSARGEDDEEAAATPHEPSEDSNPAPQEPARQRVVSFPHETPKPHAEHSSDSARSLTIAGYGVQLVGIAGLATGAALGVEQRTETQAASNALAIGGAVAVLAGTILVASGSPITFGPPPTNFIELR